VVSTICDSGLASAALMRVADNEVRYASKAPNELRDKECHPPALTILLASFLQARRHDLATNMSKSGTGACRADAPFD
jgi:hypothetical protein